ncbi:MAG: hypothetical protein JWM73_1485 [Solirubrobacterales bacterium]|nr:hypothetical protein [Solirubrobacterales bacterium]
MCEHVFVSSGSPYARFRRALATGNLALVHAAATELPQVDLQDALRICLLMSDHDDERFERAAVRWLARASLETPTMRLDDLRMGLIAFEAMPYNQGAARQTLAQLCAAHRLEGAARVLSGSAR